MKIIVPIQVEKPKYCGPKRRVKNFNILTDVKYSGHFKVHARHIIINVNINYNI